MNNLKPCICGSRFRRDGVCRCWIMFEDAIVNHCPYCRDAMAEERRQAELLRNPPPPAPFVCGGRCHASRLFCNSTCKEQFVAIQAEKDQQAWKVEQARQAELAHAYRQRLLAAQQQAAEDAARDAHNLACAASSQAALGLPWMPNAATSTRLRDTPSYWPGVESAFHSAVAALNEPSRYSEPTRQMKNIGGTSKAPYANSASKTQSSWMGVLNERNNEPVDRTHMCSSDAASRLPGRM